MEKSHELLIWDRAICTWLCYLEKCLHMFLGAAWSACGVAVVLSDKLRGNSTKEGNQLFYIIKEGKYELAKWRNT